MSAKQLAGWWAYYQCEPFGAVRDDFRAAQVGAAVVNNIPLRGRGARALKPEDFFGTLRRPARDSVGEMAARAAAIVAAFGGETVRAKGAGGG